MIVLITIHIINKVITNLNNQIQIDTFWEQCCFVRKCIEFLRNKMEWISLIKAIISNPVIQSHICTRGMKQIT